MSGDSYPNDSPNLGGTTSAQGLVSLCGRVPRLPVIVISASLFVSGTSAAEPNQLWEAPYVRETDATSGGLGFAPEEIPAPEIAVESSRRAISELRKLSGLTWDQLGQLFEVSRRSVHFWASGKPLNAENETRLMRVLNIVHGADRGSASGTRTALLKVSDGVTAFEMLVARRFEEARARLGDGGQRPTPALSELNADAKSARKPLPPEELFEAKHDRAHREPRRARAARTVRSKPRGSS